jgi:hypothetical protein
LLSSLHRKEGRGQQMQILYNSSQHNSWPTSINMHGVIIIAEKRRKRKLQI